MTARRRLGTASLLALAWSGGAVLAHQGEKDHGSETSTLLSPDGREVPVRHTGGHTGPKALLLHGVSASKEAMMFDADALSAAGYDCTLLDFPGNGASRSRFSDSEEALVDTIRAATMGNPQAFDVVVGHSMGAFAARAAVRRGVLLPRMLVTLGVPAGSHSVALLGAWDELVDIHRPGSPDLSLFVSPFSDHVTEVFDPLLAGDMLAAVQPGRPWFRWPGTGAWPGC